MPTFFPSSTKIKALKNVKFNCKETGQIKDLHKNIYPNTEKVGIQLAIFFFN